ncbi:hypothetical protein [Bradyrhizobium sp.]|uniref:hypothetical protein n=1 Tax=Bradyrhizobium sp. TaxID=376 RepID=UPI003C72E905
MTCQRWFGKRAAGTLLADKQGGFREDYPSVLEGSDLGVTWNAGSEFTIERDCHRGTFEPSYNLAAGTPARRGLPIRAMGERLMTLLHAGISLFSANWLNCLNKNSVVFCRKTLGSD